MNNNFNSSGLISDTNMNLGKNYPYTFNDINDATIPAGYETSLPKNLYLSRERLYSNQVRPLIQQYNLINKTLIKLDLIFKNSKKNQNLN